GATGERRSTEREYPVHSKEGSALMRFRGSRTIGFPTLFAVAAIAGGATSQAQQAHTTWKDYLGGPDSSHYSALKQINAANVKNLDVAWSYPTGDDTSYTFSPLVMHNIAYVAAKGGSLVALDATTGK